MDMGAAFFVLHPYTTEDFIGEQMEKKIKIKTNLTAGIIFVMMALGVAVLIPSQIKMTSIVKEAVDSRFIPQILCWVMGVLGCWLIIKSLMLKKEDYLEISLNQEKRRACSVSYTHLDVYKRQS